MHDVRRKLRPLRIGTLPRHHGRHGDGMGKAGRTPVPSRFGTAGPDVRACGRAPRRSHRVRRRHPRRQPTVVAALGRAPAQRGPARAMPRRRGRQHGRLPTAAASSRATQLRHPASPRTWRQLGSIALKRVKASSRRPCPPCRPCTRGRVATPTRLPVRCAPVGRRGSLCGARRPPGTPCRRRSPDAATAAGTCRTGPRSWPRTGTAAGAGPAVAARAPACGCQKVVRRV
jgi:hypothetical protein